MKCVISLTSTILLVFLQQVSWSQPRSQPSSQPRYDLSVQPVLYTVGYAHLDTEWRWDYEETIRVHLKNTLDDNFQRFEKYKPYVFTFSGARRYRMMKEYYPSRYEKMKRYIEQGRWFVGGSSVDECDANIPSPESVIRQVLYGNNYFKKEFSRQSVDFLLPDCFGFQAHLPSALAHAGVEGFSTQKLEWGSAVGIPFNLGKWIGPDGKGVVAALNATDYTGSIEKRLDTVKYWVDRVMDNGKKYGVFADYRYYGVGDVGGAPREKDVVNAVGSLDQPDRLINIYLSSSDQLFRDLTPDQKNSLPVYSGDLLLTQHSAGSLTSQAAMKRWNRQNEQLALATEPLAAMAEWLGPLSYPAQRINEAWWLVLGSQMHDILPGTSIPKAYEYAWNDEILAMNQFAAAMTSSATGVIHAMDTRGKGQTLVVYNPLAIPRKDLVDALLEYPGGAPQWVRVIDPDNNEIPVQIIPFGKNTLKILFVASVPSLGLACYDVIPADKPGRYTTSLTAGKNFLENEWLKVTINTAGDISSVIDKKTGRETLSAPSRLLFLKEHPEYWPAWNMDWYDRQQPPAGYVDGPAEITLVESGPVRSVIRVVRKAQGSLFRQFIILVAGKENVQIHNYIDWQSKGVSLKASFPLKAANPKATYNLGLGTIERGNNDKDKYEVPSREWFDLTDLSGNFGTSILENCKFGSDKPDDHTIRLTLLYTPATNFYHDQATQDWGTHEIIYALYPHKGDWRNALTEWQARALNQPLKVFTTAQHTGPLGKSFSFAQCSTPRIDLRALKKAENGNHYILRLQELTGQEINNVEISLAGKIVTAWEVDGQEQRIGDATIKNGKLVTDFNKFGIRSFAVKPEAPIEKNTPRISVELPLPFTLDVVSADGEKSMAGMDGKGTTFPAELFPDTLNINGVPFKLGRKNGAQNNALSCSGQKILLPRQPAGNRLYLLAAATHDTTGLFRIGNDKTTLTVRSCTGKIGQFDQRIWDQFGRIKGLTKGFIQREEVGWFSPHMHRDTTNLPYQYGSLFLCSLDVSPGSTYLQLPENESIRIFAVTLTNDPLEPVTPAWPLYDDYTERQGFTPDIPISFVKDNMKPAAAMKAVRKKNLNDLPGRVTMKDYADIHQPNGVVARYYSQNRDSCFTAAGIYNGMDVPVLIDGMFDLMPGDTAKDCWSTQGEGRIWMDLQRETEPDSIHLFTVLSTRRGPQKFSLWGATGEKSPAITGDPATAGWEFIAWAGPIDIWGNSIGLYTLKNFTGKTRNIRYLLWISEDSPHGPCYFREVDVFEKQH